MSNRTVKEKAIACILEEVGDKGTPSLSKANRLTFENWLRAELAKLPKTEEVKVENEQ